MKVILTIAVLLGLPVAIAPAGWLEVSPSVRVNPAAVLAVEIRSEANIKEASIRTQSAEHAVKTSTVVAEVEALVADATAWFPGRGETIGNKSIKRYVRKNAVLFVSYACPPGTCTAFVDGPHPSFSRVVIEHADAISELKRETTTATAFTLVESPSAGFETFVRRTAIRAVSFICSSANNCTQADIQFPGGTRITRDSAGIRALLATTR